MLISTGTTLLTESDGNFAEVESEIIAGSTRCWRPVHDAVVVAVKSNAAIVRRQQNCVGGGRLQDKVFMSVIP